MEHFNTIYDTILASLKIPYFSFLFQWQSQAASGRVGTHGMEIM
jgi:hypothetical protein